MEDEDCDNLRILKIESEDNLPLVAEDSNTVDKELASEMIKISKTVLEWLLILISIALMYYLMSPRKKM